MHVSLASFKYRIRKLFAERLNPAVCYHKLDHTLSIVDKVNEVDEYYYLDKQSLENLFFDG